MTIPICFHASVMPFHVRLFLEMLDSRPTSLSHVTGMRTVLLCCGILAGCGIVDSFLLVNPRAADKRGDFFGSTAAFGKRGKSASISRGGQGLLNNSAELYATCAPDGSFKPD